jgi:hypothetical protein
VIDFGAPRSDTTMSSAAATLSPLSAVSAWSVRHSRVY